MTDRSDTREVINSLDSYIESEAQYLGEKEKR